MSPRKTVQRIEDILDALQDIFAFTAGMTYEIFRSDKKTLMAVLFNLATIGEAARHIDPSLREQYPEVPWKEMCDSRNFIIHEYFGIDTDVVWRTVQEDLPALTIQLRAVLENMA